MKNKNYKQICLIANVIRMFAAFWLLISLPIAATMFLGAEIISMVGNFTL